MNMPNLKAGGQLSLPMHITQNNTEQKLEDEAEERKELRIYFLLLIYFIFS